LARWIGLRNAVRSTADPSRIRSVHAAAYVSNVTGSRLRTEPKICSTTHTLSKPSASARERNPRMPRTSKLPERIVCGIATPSRTPVVTGES